VELICIYYLICVLFYGYECGLGCCGGGVVSVFIVANSDSLLCQIQGCVGCGVYVVAVWLHLYLLLGIVILYYVK
jgi:hypothetical protein